MNQGNNFVLWNCKRRWKSCAAINASLFKYGIANSCVHDFYGGNIACVNGEHVFDNMRLHEYTIPGPLIKNSIKCTLLNLLPNININFHTHIYLIYKKNRIFCVKNVFLVLLTRLVTRLSQIYQKARNNHFNTFFVCFFIMQYRFRNLF